MTTGRSAAGRRSTEAEPLNLKLRMAPENEPCRWRIQDDVLFRPVDGDIVLLHLGSGRYHGLEEVGARIWNLLADRPTTAQIVARLADEYDVDPAVLDRDVSAFIESLRAGGLIAPCPD
jgi:PqqD family protein of HPr-rel-A system